MVSIDNNCFMTYWVLTICFFDFTFITFLIFTHSNKLGDFYFEKIQLNDNTFKHLKLKKDKSYLPVQHGCARAKNILAYTNKLLYPLKVSNNFVIRYKEVIRYIDDKIDSCKLKFYNVKKCNFAKYCAKNIINILYFKNNKYILQFFTNVKLQTGMSKRTEKYVKYMILEEIVIWIEKLSGELKDMQRIILKAKYYPNGYTDSKISDCEVYGLLRYNPRANIILYRNNVDVRCSICNFLNELKEYKQSLVLLTSMFKEIYDTIL